MQKISETTKVGRNKKEIYMQLSLKMIAKEAKCRAEMTSLEKEATKCQIDAEKNSRRFKSGAEKFKKVQSIYAELFQTLNEQKLP